MKILIAEDDNTSRSMLTAIAKKWGYDVVAVENGVEAWDLLQQDDAPRLLIIDWMMPELDGPTLCQKIREKESSDPPYVILLTAKSKTADIVSGLEAGANDYIPKPFNHAELKARLGVGERMLELQKALNDAKVKLTHQALHDPLTGVFNRGAIMETFEKELVKQARGVVESFCVAMLDLDYFKRINDTYGHLAGDEVLKEFVRRTKQILRPYDHFGRFGGEEFLLLAFCDGDNGKNLMERIRRGVVDHAFAFLDKKIDVTVSIGAIQINEAKNTTEILAHADDALYKAKEQGRNQVVWYSDSIENPLTGSYIVTN